MHKNYKKVDFFEEADKLENGKEKIKYLKECIAIADREGDIDTAMDLRKSLMHESYTFSDSYDLVLNFPEYMAKMDSLEPKYITPHKKKHFMQSFGYYIRSAGNYYQITKKTVEELLEEYKERCRKYGYSLRSYYRLIIRFDDDLKTLKKLMKLYRKEKKDDLDRSRINEIILEIQAELHLGNAEEAHELEKLLYSGEIKLKENEHGIYLVNTLFMRYYNNLNIYEKMKPYIQKVYEFVKESPFDTDTSQIILFYVNVDIPQGLKAWKGLINKVWALNNPTDRFEMYYASYWLFRSLELTGKNRVNCPEISKDSPLYNKSGRYSTVKLKDWFFNEALILGKKMDNKNGFDWYVICLERLGKITSNAIRKHIGFEESYDKIKAELNLNNIEKALELEQEAYSGEFEKNLAAKGLKQHIIKELAELRLYEILELIAEHFRKKGNYKKLKPYAERIYEIVRASTYELDLGSSLFYICYFDLYRALEIWKDFIGRFWESNNCAHKLHLLMVTFFLFKNLEHDGVAEIEFTAFPEKFPLYNESGNYKTAELRDWFYTEAETSAIRYDKEKETEKEKEKKEEKKVALLKKMARKVSPAVKEKAQT